MPLLPDQLDDFVNLTLPRFFRRKWVDISLEHQRYIVANKMFRKRKQRYGGGTQVEWKVQVTNTGTAKNTEMFAVDDTNVKDLTQAAVALWTKQTVNFSYDIDEPAFQSTREMIVRELEMRRHSMYNDYFELQEQNLWTAPTSTSETPRRPNGIPFWLQKDATTTPGGAFNGGNPSGFSAGAGGLSSSTYPRWANWTFGYTRGDVGRDVFVERLRKALEFTYFMAPHDFAELGGSGGPSSPNACYTTYRVLQPLEKLAEGRNDNLGADLGVFMGKLAIKGTPISWVPYLEANDTSDPIYGVNWDVFIPYCKTGRDMYVHPVQKSAHQHSVREVHMDSWSQFACLNRRLCFVGSS